MDATEYILTLRKLRIQYGDDALRDSRRVRGFLMDAKLSSTGHVHLLVEALEEGLIQELVQQGAPDDPFIKTRLVSRMQNKRRRSKEDAEWALAAWQRTLSESDEEMDAVIAEYGNLGELSELDQNYDEAVMWYRKAADLGHADSQCNLGRFYEEGVFAEQNYAEAGKWYRKAAVQGQKCAMSRLGLFYLKGLGGLPQDGATALKYSSDGCSNRNQLELAELLAAGQQGDLASLYRLGLCYLSGEMDEEFGDTFKDVEQGNHLISQAAQEGFPIAIERMRISASKVDNFIPSHGVIDDEDIVKFVTDLKTDRAEVLGWIWIAFLLGNLPARDFLENWLVEPDERAYLQAVYPEDLLSPDRSEQTNISLSELMIHVHRNSIKLAAADDEWEYMSNTYEVNYCMYTYAHGALGAASEAFAQLLHHCNQSIFLVRQPDQTYVLVPYSSDTTIFHIESRDFIINFCGNNWIGDAKVRWSTSIHAQTPNEAVDLALKDLKGHREQHVFFVQFKDMPSIAVSAGNFSLSA